MNNQNPQSGNILFYILIAIFLIGMLTVALRNPGSTDGGIDREAAAVKAQQIIKYGSELTQAVRTILENGASESEIRFAHPDADIAYGTITTTPQFQVFSNEGGKAAYRLPPAGVNDGSKWMFDGHFAIPHMGSQRSDLIAILRVNQPVCAAINNRLGLSDIPALVCDPITFFAGVYPATPTPISPTPFGNVPVPQICYQCSNDPENFSYMNVLYAR